MQHLQLFAKGAGGSKCLKPSRMIGELADFSFVTALTLCWFLRNFGTEFDFITKWPINNFSFGWIK
jgi:hypothetical protein